MRHVGGTTRGRGSSSSGAAARSGASPTTARARRPRGSAPRTCPTRRSGRAPRPPHRDHDGDLRIGRALVVDLARRARERGAIVQFDPNFRAALPDTAAAAAERQREVLPYVDWYLTGEGEARASGATSRSPRASSCVSARAGRSSTASASRARARSSVVDEIGAGTRSRRGSPTGCSRVGTPVACAHAGNVLAAHALGGTGTGRRCPASPRSPTSSSGRRSGRRRETPVVERPRRRARPLDLARGPSRLEARARSGRRR